MRLPTRAAEDAAERPDQRRGGAAGVARRYDTSAQTATTRHARGRAAAAAPAGAPDEHPERRAGVAHVGEREERQERDRLVERHRALDDRLGDLIERRPPTSADQRGPGAAAGRVIRRPPRSARRAWDGADRSPSGRMTSSARTCRPRPLDRDAQPGHERAVGAAVAEHDLGDEEQRRQLGEPRGEQRGELAVGAERDARLGRLLHRRRPAAPPRAPS